MKYRPYSDSLDFLSGCFQHAFLCYETMWSGTQIPLFWRNLLHLSLGLFCTAYIPRCLNSLLPWRSKYLQVHTRFAGVKPQKIKSHLYLLLCLCVPWKMSLTEAFKVLLFYTNSIVYHFHKFTAIFLEANLNNSSPCIQTIFHQFFHCCCQSQNNLRGRLSYITVGNLS